MRLVSVNVSAGRVVSWRGKRIETGIFKEPVAGRVMVRRSNLDGDRQADRSVHGGEHKAVYAYAADHYAWWRRELSREIPFGMFGENLTIEAFPEHDVCVGDVFRVGRVLVAASHRGRGLAGVLMARAHELCAGRPVVLDAQSYLVEFYTGLGYEVTGPEFLDDGIPHLPMRRPVQE